MDFQEAILTINEKIMQSSSKIPHLAAVIRLVYLPSQSPTNYNSNWIHDLLNKDNSFKRCIGIGIKWTLILSRLFSSRVQNRINPQSDPQKLSQSSKRFLTGVSERDSKSENIYTDLATLELNPTILVSSGLLGSCTFPVLVKKCSGIPLVVMATTLPALSW